MAKGRVLLCGEVKGQFEKLPKLLDALQQKGSFDFALCIGDFIGSGTYGSAPKQDVGESIGRDEHCRQNDSSEESSRGHSHSALNALLAAELADVYACIKDLSGRLPISIYILDDVLCSYGRLAATSDGSFNKSSENPSSCGNSILASHAGSDSGFKQPLPAISDFTVKNPPGGAEEDSSPRVTTSSTGARCEEPGRLEIKAADIASRFSKVTAAIPLLPNIYVLPQAGIVDLFGLHIACMAVDFVSTDTTTKDCVTDVKEECLFSQQMVEQNSRFRGKVDLLLSNRPPHAIFDLDANGVEPSENTVVHALGSQILEERGTSFAVISQKA